MIVTLIGIASSVSGGKTRSHISSGTIRPTLQTHDVFHLGFRPKPAARKISTPPGGRGFALTVTLSLMIRLVAVAVGLLTLSTLSVRSAGQGKAIGRPRIGTCQDLAGPATVQAVP